MGIQKRLNTVTYGIIAIAVLFAIISLTISWGECTFILLEDRDETFTVAFFLTKVAPEIISDSISWGNWVDDVCVVLPDETRTCPNCSGDGVGTIIVAIIGFVSVAIGTILTVKNRSVVDSTERKMALAGIGMLFVGALLFLGSAFVFKNQCLGAYDEITQLCSVNGPGFGMMIASMVFLTVAIIVRLVAVLMFPTHPGGAKSAPSSGAATVTPDV